MGLHSGTLNIATIVIVVRFINVSIRVTIVTMATVVFIERILVDREIW
jgi:hypothetical protein